MIGLKSHEIIISMARIINKYKNWDRNSHIFFMAKKLNFLFSCPF